MLIDGQFYTKLSATSDNIYFNYITEVTNLYKESINRLFEVELCLIIINESLHWSLVAIVLNDREILQVLNDLITDIYIICIIKKS